MRRVRRQLIVGVVGVIAVLSTLTSAGSGAAPPSCNVGDLQLRSSTVNQGLGSYDRLVRGKETLVRLFLSLPSCAGTTASIQITGGTLRANGAGTTLASGITGTPTPVNVFPSVATYSTAALVDAPADIKFVVPGSALAPAGTINSYTASFRADLTFQYKTSSNASLVTGVTKTFDNFASKTVEKKTNALRILVIPMGNAANSYSSEFPPAAVAAVENGMQTLSRIFPVPSGVGTLGGSSGGIRYAINPTLLNVGTTPWCGDGANFDPIKAQLAQFLVSWNTANPTAQADRVVGAISSDKSLPGTSGCAEGMASLVSPEAWVRAIPDAADAPSPTGALFAMEIAHTFGLVPSARSYGSFHSVYTAADATDPNRGYNVALRAFLADDHSVMKSLGAWNNNTTILEKADYAYLVCVLGGTTNAECTTPAVAGSATGVAALSTAFALTGHTDGITPLGTIPAGTVAQESYVAAELEGRGTESGSEYKLVQRGGNNAVLQTTGVRVAFEDTIHEQPNDPDQIDSEIGTFAVVAGLNISAQKFELWKGTPGSGILLWSALKTNPPVIVPGSFTTALGGVRNFTRTSFLSEDEPSLTADASWVAYGAGSGISVAPVVRPQSAVSIPLPTGLRANGKIVYSELGVLKAVNPDASNPVTIYDGAKDGVFGASEPEWSPDFNRVVFSAARTGVDGKDIYVVNRNGSGLRRLTTDPAFDTKPTWSAKGLIIFVRGPQGGGPTTELYSVRPDGTGETRLTDNGVLDDAPAASPDGNQIAWETGGGISKMNIDGSGVTSLFSGNAFDPDWSPTGGRIAFGANLYPFETTDIYMINSDGTGQRMVTDTVGPDQYEFGPKWSGDEEKLVAEQGGQGPGARRLALVTVPTAGSIPEAPVQIGSVTGNTPDWANIPTAPPSGAAWGTSTGDGAKLAFVFRESLYTLDVDLSGAAPRFGDPVLHYSGSSIEGPGPAVHPTWSPDESSIAFTEGEGQFSNIIVLNLTDDTYGAITDDEGASHPSWSRGVDTNVIAYEKAGVTGGREIWTINPADAQPTPVLLISNATQPSWGADGRLAFGRSGIWVWTPPVIEGAGTEAKVFDNGSDPSLAGNTFAFVRVVGGVEFSPTDIFIGSPVGININVEVTDDNPGDNRLDLLVDCPGLTYVGAVALRPTDVQGASASWAANFDPSLTCADPTLRVAVSDGYNRVLSGARGTGQEIANEAHDPTAAIYTPPAGSTFREYDVIPARGGGWDAEDGTLPDAKLAWRLEGPGGFLRTDPDPSTNPGHSIVDFSPPATGFPLSLASGDYTLTLTVTDSDGRDGTATTTFTIVEDADNDGLTIDEETQGCVTNDPVFVEPPGYMPDADPLNSFRDGDLDGIPNVDDPAICTAATAYEAIVDVDADMVKSQPTGVITGFVRLRYRPITAVNGATVEIASINGITANIPTLKWTIDKNGVGISKFDKNAVIKFLNDHGIGNGYALVTISGRSFGNSWTFEGSDLMNVH